MHKVTELRLCILLASSNIESNVGELLSLNFSVLARAAFIGKRKAGKPDLWYCCTTQAAGDKLLCPQFGTVTNTSFASLLIEHHCKLQAVAPAHLAAIKEHNQG